MVQKTPSVVSLDPIDRQKRTGIIGRFFMTRRFGGKAPNKSKPFGHYLFCGKQRQGKTVSAVWYVERLTTQYSKKGYKVVIFSNMGIGMPVKRSNLLQVLNSIEYKNDTIYIFLLDEIQAWYPKDTKDKALLQQIDALTGEFSQLGKRNIFVISTAQIYGRVNKNLREQCLFMIDCRLSKLTGKCINEFIPSDDIMCDELGRWSGNPVKIYVHGLAKNLTFDTHKRVMLD